MYPLTSSKDPELPTNIRETLRAILSTSPPPSEDTVRAAVDQISLDSGIRREVASWHGAIGVALRAGQLNCVMAQLADGQVTVWSPSHVQLAPES
jgi:hypothetical protein